LFTFIGNKINRANIAKRTKEGTRKVGRLRSKRRRAVVVTTLNCRHPAVVGQGVVTATGRPDDGLSC